MGARSLPSLVLLWLLLLLLRGTSAAPVQGKAVSPPCEDLEGGFYNKEYQRCCHQCPTGFAPKTECPTNPQSDCVKQCQRSHFLNYQYATPRCEECVSCDSGRSLVQKMPCTNSSSGVCECQPGLYCSTRIPNTCARCSPLTTCKPGFGVKIRGTSDRDTVCEECPLGTSSKEDSSTETCKPRAVARSEKVAEKTDNSTLNGLGVSPHWDRTVQPTTVTETKGSTHVLVSWVSSNVPEVITGQPVNESNTRGWLDIRTPEKSSKEEEKDVTFLAAALLLVLLLLAVLVVLWKRRACRKWIVPHRVKTSSPTKICAMGSLCPAEKSPEETEPMRPESITESSSGSPLGTEGPPGLDHEGVELLQVDGGVLLEPAVRSHTSNCIEKIYIMRADTVIVGSVSEVPPGKSCPGRGEEGVCGAQEEAEESEVDVHYPEQETEFSPGSDITTPVEEEWEFPHSILANEKLLESQKESPGVAT